MYALNKKLQLLKAKLVMWNKETLGNFQDNVKTYKDKLKSINNQVGIVNYCDDIFLQEKQAQLGLDNALKIKEIFWKEKANVQWNMEGDRNTKYFQIMSKIKNATKLTYCLKHENNYIRDQDEISSHVV